MDIKEVRDGSRAHLAGAFQMEGTESENALGVGVPGVWEKKRVTVCVELSKKSENEVREVRGGGNMTKKPL